MNCKKKKKLWKFRDLCAFILDVALPKVVLVQFSFYLKTWMQAVWKSDSCVQYLSILCKYSEWMSAFVVKYGIYLRHLSMWSHEGLVSMWILQGRALVNVNPSTEGTCPCESCKGRRSQSESPGVGGGDTCQYESPEEGICVIVKLRVYRHTSDG